MMSTAFRNCLFLAFGLLALMASDGVNSLLPCKAYNGDVYLVKLKNNVPHEVAIEMTRKSVLWNFQSISKAKQAFLVQPSFGGQFEKGIDYQYGCCLLGRFRWDTIQRVGHHKLNIHTYM